MKKWYQSKTIMVAALTFIGSVATAYVNGLSWEAGAVAFVAALQVFLRTITTVPLGATKEEPK